MNDADVGIQVAAGVDASGAEQGFREFASHAEGAFGRMDEGVLNAHHSIHLLLEEMGVRLPRAVVGAIAEMLPSIAGLGGAILGVFAVEKVYEWVEESQKALHEAYMEAHEDIEALDKAAAEAFKHMKVEADEAFTHFETSLAGSFQIAELDAEMKKLLKYYKAFKELREEGNRMTRERGAELGAIVNQALNEGMNNLEDVTKKINEVGALQFEAHKHMAEVTAKEHKKSADEAKKAAEERKRRIREAEEENRQELTKLAGWYAADDAAWKKHLDSVREGITKANADKAIWDRGEREMVEQLNAALAKLPPTLNELGKALPLPKFHEWNVLLHDLTHATDEETKGLAANTAHVAQNVASILDTLGAKREYAATMAIYETAKGFEALGDYDFWGAAQDFASAAMYAKVAGSSSGHNAGGAHGSRGVARGSASDSGGGSPSGVERGGGGPSGGSSSGSGQTIVQIQGNLNTNGQQQLAAWIGMGSSVGLYKLNASGSSGIAASRY